MPTNDQMMQFYSVIRQNTIKENKTINTMLKPLFFCLFSLFSLSLTHAQTPQQSYFEWTELPFSKEELAQRRSNFVSELQAQNKEGLVLIPAKDGFSYGETFRQLDDFYYFTGLELSNAILAIEVPSGNTMVFTPEMDKRFHSASRPNDFPGRPLLYDSEIVSQSGLALKNIEEFSTYITSKTSKIIIINNIPSMPMKNRSKNKRQKCSSSSYASASVDVLCHIRVRFAMNDMFKIWVAIPTPAWLD